MRRSRTGPWKPLATVGFSVLIAVSFVVAQFVVAVAYLVVQIAGQAEPDVESAAAALRADGLLVSIAEIVAAPIAIVATVFFAWLRRGPSVREYLALRSTDRGTAVRWLLSALLVAVLLDGAASVSGRAVVPEWVLSVYGSVSLPLLALALVALAPVSEELLFRGFLFEGLHHSRLGTPGTIVVTAVAWALIHVQYEWFYIGQVFVLGLLLGAARARTGSVVLAVLMHCLLNVVSLLEASLAGGG